MKVKECKGCKYLDKEYNASCQQFCGPRVCNKINQRIKDMNACPLNTEEEHENNR